MIWLYIITGIVGGIIGGMGMGGGTLLIPLLTLVCGITQHIAQSINLISFIPMCVVALIIHAKNKLVKGKYFLFTAIPASVVAFGASLLAKNLEGETLSQYFGWFLLALGIYQLVMAVINLVKKFKQKERK